MCIRDRPSTEGIYPQFVDPEGYWAGIAGRARVILVNTDLLSPEEYPESIYDLLDPRWPAEQVGIAYPMFGTTSTHAAALYAYLGEDKARAFFEGLAERGVKVVDGNSVAKDLVAAGRLAFAMTDTDDACAAIKAGRPVTAVVPDQGDGGMGTLVIPNTIALVRGAPHPQEAQALIDYLDEDDTPSGGIDDGRDSGDGYLNFPCTEPVPLVTQAFAFFTVSDPKEVKTDSNPLKWYQEYEISFLAVCEAQYLNQTIPPNLSSKKYNLTISLSTPHLHTHCISLQLISPLLCLHIRSPTIDT